VIVVGKTLGKNSYHTPFLMVGRYLLAAREGPMNPFWELMDAESAGEQEPFFNKL
jgi:hypothetical protein